MIVDQQLNLSLYLLLAAPDKIGWWSESEFSDKAEEFYDDFQNEKMSLETLVDRDN